MPLVRTWAFVPMVLFLILAAGQIVPLPQEIVAKISPNTVATKTRLLADLPDSGALLKTMTLSFYPPATRQMLKVVLAACVVFVVVSNTFRKPQQIMRLLLAVAIIGTATALFALGQDIAGGKQVFFQIYPVKRYRADAGPFVNHNNFAQFMNLSIGAGLGLILVHLKKAEGHRRHRRRSLPSILKKLGEPEYAIVRYLAGMVALGAISIFLSRSRGGMISMLGSFAATAVLVSIKDRGRGGLGWILSLLGLLVFVGLLYAGFDMAYDRLATLKDPERAAAGRFQVNKDVLERLAPEYRAVGVGLGSHEMVYPMVSRREGAGTVGHVENEYVQLIEEMGVAGCALAGLFLIFVLSWYLRAIFSGKRSIQAAAFGLGFGLLAVMIHSASDFGQRLPANACLSAAFCGLLLGLYRIAAGKGHASADEEEPEGNPDAIEQGEQEEPEAKPAKNWPRRSRLGAMVGLMMLGLGGAVAVAAWGWVIKDASGAAKGEGYWKKAVAEESRLSRENWMGTDADYVRLLNYAAGAAEAQPDNVLYKYWLNTYRWCAISRELDPQTGQIILTEESMGYTRRIVDELNATRALCPTYGPAWFMAGQLELQILGNPIGEKHIQMGCDLAPNHPTVRFIVGRINARAGKWDAAMAEFEEALKLGHPLREVIELLVYEFDRPDLALKAADQDARGLLDLANILIKAGRAPTTGQSWIGALAEDGLEMVFNKADKIDRTWLPADPKGDRLMRLANAMAEMIGPPPEDEGEAPATKAMMSRLQQRLCAAVARRRANGLLAEWSKQPDAPAWVFGALGDAAARDQEWPKAIEQYQRALALSYNSVEYHFTLAQALDKNGQTEKAIHEARICLRLSPDNASAKWLIGRLSTKPTTRVSR